MILRGQVLHIKISGVLSTPDFHLICEGKTIPCHKDVLAAQSTFFGVLLKPGNEWKENQTGELKIEDFSLKTVQSMLEFIYTQQLSNTKDYTRNLLMIADKYDIKSLFDRCDQELASQVCLDNVLDLHDILKWIYASQLKRSTVQFIAKNYDAVKGQRKYTDMTSEEKTLLGSQVTVFWMREIQRLDNEMKIMERELRRLNYNIWRLTIRLPVRL
jgi:hypothetical protein